MSQGKKNTANKDIRDYMSDHGVTQKLLAEWMGVSEWKISTMLKNELSQKEKEHLILHIDTIANMTPDDEEQEVPE